MATVVYTLRLSGFLLAGTAVPPAWERTLGFVPVATLTALVVASLAARPDEGALRLMAAVGAACAARYTGRAWVCIVVGIVVYGLLRLFWMHAG
jgi:branched-subunit amino acid transport protein